MPEADLLKSRLEKLEKIIRRGINPYPARCSRSHTTQEAHNNSSERVTVAGRLIALRPMGRAAFAQLQDATGKIQVYLKEEALGKDRYEAFSLFDLGDFGQFSGPLFTTKTGELTVRVEEFALLSKTLRPLPEKWHGLKDQEERYRQRHLDLLCNPDSREALLLRSRMICEIRRFLETQEFLEVETPVMQTLPGGAAARPFTTVHHALKATLFLRVAPELYLKRLVAGGLEKVFEIGRCFRNEGIDTQHNPEFTLLELYWAYADYRAIAKLTETLIRNVAKALKKEKEELKTPKGNVNLSAPFRQVKLADLFREATGMDLSHVARENLWQSLTRFLPEGPKNKLPDHKVFDHLFETRITPGLIQPTFVMDYPRAFSPLAKSKEEEPEIVERFELFIGGEEMANAYSELNDPLEQRKRLEDQMSARRAGDEEAMPMDEDFLKALEHGMPPCGGLGIGLDRLSMLFSERDSIRDVLWFPLLRER